MKNFSYRQGDLYWKSTSVPEIADEIQTPFYLYHYESLMERIQEFNQAFSDYPTLICYALKANSNRALLTILNGEGFGVDVVSGGEIKRALAAGISPDKIVFAGVGKRDDEIKDALDEGILAFNVESLPELNRIAEIAEKKSTVAPISMRVNPNIDPQTHPYISTGLKENKFGVDFPAAEQGYELALEHDYLEPVGIHVHIGSQITEKKPFEDALSRIIEFVSKLNWKGISTRFIDIGGGLGIPYKSSGNYVKIDEYAHVVKDSIGKLDSRPQILIEPGRSLVGPVGALVSTVLYVKEKEDKVFVVVDAGMNDFLRPTLYHAWHEIIPLRSHEKDGTLTADVVGPVCESGGFFAKDRKIKAVTAGEKLAILDTGAYGYSMASNYNSRVKPTEILATKEGYNVIRQREKLANITKGERLPAFLR